jgi:hypothetical protein
MTDLDDYRYDLPKAAIRVTTLASHSATVLIWFWPEQGAILEAVLDRILKEGRIRATAFTTLPARARSTMAVSISALPGTKTLVRVMFGLPRLPPRQRAAFFRHPNADPDRIFPH